MVISIMMHFEPEVFLSVLSYVCFSLVWHGLLSILFIGLNNENGNLCSQGYKFAH